jgi:hypothetical protein
LKPWMNTRSNVFRILGQNWAWISLRHRPRGVQGDVCGGAHRLKPQCPALPFHTIGLSVQTPPKPHPATRPPIGHGGPSPLCTAIKHRNPPPSVLRPALLCAISAHGLPLPLLTPIDRGVPGSVFPVRQRRYHTEPPLDCCEYDLCLYINQVMPQQSVVTFCFRNNFHYLRVVHLRRVMARHLSIYILSFHITATVQ